MTPIREVMVNGQRFRFWGDYVLRGMYAENEAGEVKRLCSGYMKKDLTIRKAIAAAFGLSSFRK